MKGKRYLISIALTLFCFSSAYAAVQSGLVNVDISNTRTEIAKKINVDVSQVPMNVQAPVGVAANVCGVNANALAKQTGDQGATCQAKNTSSALNQIVLQQVKGQKAQ
ncbi:MAG: hypothetical protein ABFD50_01450 [Smithella sp.]